MATYTTGDGGAQGVLSAISTMYYYYPSDADINHSMMYISYSNGTRIEFIGQFNYPADYSYLNGTLTSYSITKNGALIVKMDGLNASISDKNMSDFDRLFDGADVLNLGAAADSESGFGGPDTIYGGGGADYLDGGDAADMIWGGVGADTITGGNADDQIYAGQDADMAYGEGGNDLIQTGKGRDSLYGGPGADTLRGGVDSDLMWGNEGADLFYIGAGADTIQGFSYADGDRVAAPSGYQVSISGSVAKVTLTSGDVVTVNFSGAMSADWIFVG